MIDYLFNSIPLIAGLIIWAVRLESKITKIQTDIEWIKKEIPGCQPR
jgi:hypothetical protein